MSPVFTQERAAELHKPQIPARLHFSESGTGFEFIFTGCLFIVLETGLFTSVYSHLEAEIRMFPTSLVVIQLKREHQCKCRVWPGGGGSQGSAWRGSESKVSACVLCPQFCSKPSCLSILCVSLLQRNPCPVRQLPLALWCPWVPCVGGLSPHAGLGASGSPSPVAGSPGAQRKA